ncbi:UNVERIFIED_CONTAM: hypothetical protein K2H54_033916 [Gekko kuhli]
MTKKCADFFALMPFPTETHCFPAGITVSKKYSEIEEFYQKLLSRYPQASLPSLPRKVLFVGESDIRERRVMFNEIMRSISKEANLATSPELLEFLAGTRSASVVDFKGKNLPDKEEEENDAFDFFREEGVSDVIPQFKSPKEQGVKSAKEEEDEEEDDDVDPLGVIKYNLVLFCLYRINSKMSFVPKKVMSKS